jgi:hypothetical protein
MNPTKGETTPMAERIQQLLTNRYGVTGKTDRRGTGTGRTKIPAGILLDYEDA